MAYVTVVCRLASQAPIGRRSATLSQTHLKSGLVRIRNTWPQGTLAFLNTQRHTVSAGSNKKSSKKVNLSHTLNTNPANLMEIADLSRYSVLVVASVKASLHLHRLREEHRRKLDGGWLYVLQEEQDERFWRLSEEGKTADYIKTSP